MNDVRQTARTPLPSRSGQPFFRDRRRFLVSKSLFMLARKVKRNTQDYVVNSLFEAGVACEGRAVPVRLSGIAVRMA